MKSSKITVAVAGTGYVGLSIATLLSQNNKVYAVDIIPEKVELINNKKSPIQDDYIEKYLAEHEARGLKLHATTDGAGAYSEADFVISLYNPSSHKRPDYLQKACDILLAHKDGATVCGTVRNIGREGEEANVMTLAELRDTPVDMFTTVFIGNSQTVELDGRMVTPRGYLQRED